MPSKDKLDKLIEAFSKSSEESRKKCASETEKLRVFMGDSVMTFSKLMMSEKFRISLMDVRIFELYRLLVHVLYLSLSGLYRNAFNNIRYIFESAIQSLYIDSRHSNSGLRTRIEILREVEDKREYRAVSLIDKLEINYKDLLKKEYKRLSQIIHPSHRSITEVLGFIQKSSHVEFVTPIGCKEISDITESMKIVLDMVLFRYISCAPKMRRDELQNNADLIKYSKKHRLILLPKILSARRGLGEENVR